MQKALLIPLIFLLFACNGDDSDTVIVVINNIDGDEAEQCINNSIRTTLVTPEINLDAGATPPQSSGRQITTDGVNISVARSGLKTATITTLTGVNFTLPLANNFSNTDMNFDITLAGQGNNLGTVSISLDAAAGMPSTVSTFNDLRILASVINAQVFSPTGGQTTIDVTAEAIDQGGGNYAIEISATQEGLSSTITISNISVNTTQMGLAITTTSTSGISQVSNQYPAQEISISTPNDTSLVYNAGAGDSAATTAAGLNALEGVTATAETEVSLSNLFSIAGNLRVTVNAVALNGATLTAIESEINALTNSTLAGISSVLNVGPGVLSLISSRGDDITISITSTTDGDSLTIVGDPGASSITLEADPNSDGITILSEDATTQAVVVGGAIDIQFNEGYDLDTPPNTAIFQPLSPTEFTTIEFNSFSPENGSSYNASANTTIFDSLGLEHILQLYFVKQEYDAADPTSIANHWQIHALVDSENIGDPDNTLLPPANAVATMAIYELYFNDNGSINETQSDLPLVSNWVPRDESGAENGAAGPQNILAGGTIPLPNPPTSSNFVIEVSELTQMGSGTTIFDIEQNGETADITGACD